MATEITVSFPENLQVKAQIGEFEISTDQPVKAGGDNSAASPFSLFTASIATCAGFFAIKFCRARKIDTTGMALTMRYEFDKEQKRYPEMIIDLTLPEGFPEKYRDAIIRAMDQCVVKKHIVEPPEFAINIT